MLITKNKISFSLIAGFTIFETIIGIGIFSIVSLAMYFSYSNILDVISAARFNTLAISIMEGEAEIIRNMNYYDIGTIGGSPSGKLQATKTVTVGNTGVTLNTYVHNIDDPFDGLAGGSPNDASPADYKLIEFEIICTGCRHQAPHYTTTVAPKHLESATNQGALLINVFNASGQPVSNATVNLSNTIANPDIFITDTTDINGQFYLVDTATGSSAYQITISKSGYSTDRTYTSGDPLNPNPVKAHLTVAEQQTTQATFAIDRLSTINFRTLNQFCAAVPSVDLTQTGQKLIGTSPNVVKFTQSFATDSAGLHTGAVEWDTYSFTNTDTAYQIAGENFSGPAVVNPNTTYDLTWTMEPSAPSALLVTVVNDSGQPVSDARIQLTKTGYDVTQYGGRRKITETDWSGANYTSATSDIDTSTQPGTITLHNVGGQYATSSQELISKTVDFGSAVTSWFALTWNPASQPPETGADSLKFQIAANNDNATWNFAGPDGSPSTYYTTSGTAVWPGLNGNRYLRYKVILVTADKNFTPGLQDIAIEFSSGCYPSNQTVFSGLADGTYTLSVSKSGFANFSDTGVVVSGNWRKYTVTLSP